MEESQTQNVTIESDISQISPFVYVLYTKTSNLGQTDQTILGFKRSYKAALRVAKQLQNSIQGQLPLGTHKYWWKSVSNTESNKCEYNQRKFILYSQPYNNLIQRESVEYVLYIERIQDLHLDLDNLQVHIQHSFKNRA